MAAYIVLFIVLIILILLIVFIAKEMVREYKELRIMEKAKQNLDSHLDKFRKSKYTPEQLIELLNKDFNNPHILW